MYCLFSAVLRMKSGCTLRTQSVMLRDRRGDIKFLFYCKLFGLLYFSLRTLQDWLLCSTRFFSRKIVILLPCSYCSSIHMPLLYVLLGRVPMYNYFITLPLTCPARRLFPLGGGGFLSGGGSYLSTIVVILEHKATAAVLLPSGKKTHR